MSVTPYVPRGDVSVFERMRKLGHENDFYMWRSQITSSKTSPNSSALGFPSLFHLEEG